MPSRLSESDWEVFLTKQLDRPVRVVYGRARHTVIDARSEPHAPNNGARVRLSQFFSEAPPDVQEAVAGWLRSGKRARRASNRLGEWIEEAVAALPKRVPRSSQLKPSGAVHDLSALELELSRMPAVLPPIECQPALTWGRRARSRARHSILLGSFDLERNLIRVHPVLDQVWVPDWFVRYVLFHELLHAALPPSPGAGGRTIHHSREFRQLERRYPEYKRALRWQEKHLPKLLRSARSKRTKSLQAAKLVPNVASPKGVSKPPKSLVESAQNAERVKRDRPRGQGFLFPFF